MLKSRLQMNYSDENGNSFIFIHKCACAQSENIYVWNDLIAETKGEALRFSESGRHRASPFTHAATSEEYEWNYARGQKRNGNVP